MKPALRPANSKAATPVRGQAMTAIATVINLGAFYHAAK
jgi:hypothetical protein